MNYLQEINHFYTWLESHPMSNNAICLWHALMAVNNKALWRKEFTVPVSSLQSRTSLSLDQFYRARKILRDVGLIKWQGRGGHLCAVYTIIPFEKNITTETDNSVGQDNLLSDTKCNPECSSVLKPDTTPNCNPDVSQTASINKLNKTKHKQNKNINSNDNKLSLVINKIDDANSNFKISKRKSGFDLKKENFEAIPGAEENFDPTSENEIQILTGGAALDDDLEMMDEDQAAKTTDEAWVSEVEVDEESRVPVKSGKPTVRVDYNRYIAHFNDNCPRLSKVMMLTPARRKTIRTVFLRYDHQKILKMISMAGESDFLSGENDRGWKATFDWLMKPGNFIKVLEGNYSNQNIRPKSMNHGDYRVSHFELLKEAYEGAMETREIPIDLNPHEI